MKKRSVRQSQLLHPYGPGAIIDLGQESFVMLDTEFNSSSWRPKYISFAGNKITLPRLSTRLGVNHFRTPPDNSLDKNSSLLVHRFPKWLFCPSCRRMKRWGREDEISLKEQKLEAPQCSNSECKNSVLVPMRYVAACKNGHMEDVDWLRVAHCRTHKVCDFTNPKLRFVSNGNGASLASLEIECEKCDARSDLSELQKPHFSKTIGQRCRGKQPWQGNESRVECQEALRFLLRSETAVHFSNTQSALDLGRNLISETNELGSYLRQKFMNLLDGSYPLDVVHQIVSVDVNRDFPNKYEDEVIRSQIHDIVHGDDNEICEADPDLEEWNVLTVPTAQDNGILQVRTSGWQNLKTSSIIHTLFDDILLVDRLREVRAFVSFSRVDPPNENNSNCVAANGRPVSSSNRLDWLPAVEVFGEGIFFKLSNDALNKWEKENRHSLRERQVKIQQKLQDEDNWVSGRYGSRAKILPRFVLLHTLSHALMRQLAFTCGYNLASIREKLYVFEENAGILLYTAQGDSEGSLGGLVRQGEVDVSMNLITQAIERLVWCSNDPICSEMPENGLEGLNLSACHACAIVPETSCTHLNTLLDRNLLITAGREEEVIKGFFDEIFGDTK